MADVAIVEADDTEAACGELLAELVVPQHHLRAQAHDQEQRLGVRRAENVVANLDAIGLGELRRLVRNVGQWRSP